MESPPVVIALLTLLNQIMSETTSMTLGILMSAERDNYCRFPKPSCHHEQQLLSDLFLSPSQLGVMQNSNAFVKWQ